MRYSLLSIALLSQLMACEKPITGEHATHDGSQSNRGPDVGQVATPYCEWEEIVLRDLRTQTDIGLTGQDVLAPALGLRESSMTWGADESIVDVRLSVPNPTTRVAVEVTHHAGAIRFRRATLVIPDEDLTPEVAVHCESIVEVEAKLHLETGDGALRESWDVTLRKFEADAITDGFGPTEVQLAIPLADITGSLQVLEVKPDGWSHTGDASFELFFPGSGMSGQLRVGMNTPEGGIHKVTIGRWN